MGELEPVLSFMLVLLCVSLVASIAITWIWSGRGLVYTCATLGLGLIGYLVWFAVFGNFSTGMEGLAFVIWPLLYLAMCVGAALGYGIFRIAKRE
jgi:hypothetical protein